MNFNKRRKNWEDKCAEIKRRIRDKRLHSSKVCNYYKYLIYQTDQNENKLFSQPTADRR